MLKYQQKQILKILESIREAQDEGLFADCQDGALSIGEFIEEVIGEGTQTVKLLEEYCELLYKASIGEVDSKLLRKKMIKIESSIKNELRPTRIEVVFLSYKASMSDCIELIYHAANEDPDCDAYWIPIPYCERKKDGSSGEMHFEGQEYYSNINCTSWYDYDINERHPDIIYTFAPYDDRNYMTSVHPDFYCKRLRGLTDMLVYIPYFVTNDTINQVFTQSNGVLYSHLTIVQSEAVRQRYLYGYRAFEELGASRKEFGVPDEKIIALGSPKFDVVQSAKPEDFIMPDEWQKLILKPDGTRKKVLLYCSSVGPVLEGGAGYIDKLRSILDFFSKRDDIILWFRPHPLTRNTYATLKADLLEAYDEIVEKYIKEQRGIFDDTSELHRAIVQSDAYYGDMGSLPFLYGITGKPMLIQNTYTSDKMGDAYYGLLFDTMYDDGEYYWFAALNHNALYKMDKTTWKAAFAGEFPDESGNEFFLYRTIAENNGKLYFAPCLAKEIAEYNKQTGKFRKIPFKKEEKQSVLQSTGGGRFSSVFSYKKWVYFFSCDYPAFLRYDTENDTIEYFSDWLDKIVKNATPNENVFFSSFTRTGESEVAAAAVNANAIVYFDLESCTSKVKIINDKVFGYQATVSDNKGNLWLIPRRDGPLVKYNTDNNEYTEFDFRPEEFSGKGIQFSGAVLRDDYLWLFPFDKSAKMVLKINTETGEAVIAGELQDICEHEIKEREFYEHYFFAPMTITTSNEDEVFVHTGRGNRLIRFNAKTGERKEGIIPPAPETPDNLKRMRRSYMHKTPDVLETVQDCLIVEGGYAFLHDYLDFIVSADNKFSEKQKEIFAKQNESGNTPSWKAIWNHCRTRAFRELSN